ncbi:MAG TPA: glucoamylase family protein [Puia sp.]|jgi:hypothetical protein|nr:glucoamylase family protein [Puia sp.]
MRHIPILLTIFLFAACSKKTSPPATPGAFSLAFTVNGSNNGTLVYSTTTMTPVIRFSFSAPIQPGGLSSNISFVSATNSTVPFSTTLQDNDSVLIIQPDSALKGFSKYTLSVSSGLQSTDNATLQNPVNITINTGLDTSNKFPAITDSALLTLVEQQTFNYFWSFGHPNCGMARERTTSGDVVTTGGSGFGIMAMLAAVQRNFITRTQALGRIDTIVGFLTGKATRFHGAFSHWINGATGATVPFSTQDDGGDIVETSYMIQGLLCARQYFNSASDPTEINLRTAINNIYDSVDWNWYRQNGQNVLYWNWSPDYNFAVNVRVSGWCEALITYVLAASSPANAIPKAVYDDGWARNGGEKNGSSFYGITLPLGPDYGGPLFFAHYSFLGINPAGLSDAYANYWAQDTAHATINYLYCVNNPGKFTGYSSSCWGLTASDEQGGYSAHAPGSADDGVISPTAAISSLPYTPTQSMNALRFFYYKLGNKIWGQYGFIDAFNLTNVWFDSDCLAIDQGPEIVMIENYRSGLLWNLFMSCPEIKTGMTNLGFSSPNL